MIARSSAVKSLWHALTPRSDALSSRRKRGDASSRPRSICTGPLARRPTISMVAERAGAQRHTIYAHFPDEISLLMACSGLTDERDPPPDATAWLDMDDPMERRRTGLSALYHWYERNAELTVRIARHRASFADEGDRSALDGRAYCGLS